MARFRDIGLWLGPQAAAWPDVRGFVDVEADQSDRNQIAYRLDAGHRTDRAYMGYSTCRICGSQNGSGELTDGVFIWPEGLGHYVRKHSVRLPVEIEDVLREPPTATELAVQNAIEADNDSRDATWWRNLAAPDVAAKTPTGFEREVPEGSI
jgi:hypothetical protein